METEHIVIGAGVAGLACARELARAGRGVVVIEKARGVGGRCATRRVDDQPIDFGVTFLHGSDPDFLAEIRSIPGATILPDWPRVRFGAGRPCQPDAFHPTERRLAIREGLSAFPKHLANGLDVRLQTRVETLAIDGDRLRALTTAGDTFTSKHVTLALPVEQTAAFVEPLVPTAKDLRAMHRLLGMVTSVPSLTVLAGYVAEGEPPAWDMQYPDDSAVLLVCHDSSKRVDPRHRVLVIQATPAWSMARLETPKEEWSRDLLAAASQCVGDWCERPAWVQAHRWKYARVDRGNELTHPVLVSMGDGMTLGLVGDVFSAGGGIQASWRSGRELGRRMTGQKG